MRRARAAANRSRAVAAAASDSALQVPRCGALIAPRHHSKATARQRHSGLSSVAMTDERKQCGKHFALRAIAPLTICLSTAIPTPACAAEVLPPGVAASLQQAAERDVDAFRAALDRKSTRLNSSH